MLILTLKFKELNINNEQLLYILSAKCEFPLHHLSATGGNSVQTTVDRVPPLEGSNVTFSCPPAFVLVGANSSTCSNEGQWEPDPKEVSCKGNFLLLCFFSIVEALMS